MKALALLALGSFLSLSCLQAEEKAAYQVKVPAMKCAGCAWSVGEELKKVSHITEIYVDPKTKVAIFSANHAEGPDEKSVLSAVKEAGYEGEGYAKLKKSFAEAKAALTKR